MALLVMNMWGISHMFCDFYGLKGKAFAFLWHVELLQFRISKDSYLQSFVIKHIKLVKGLLQNLLRQSMGILHTYQNNHYLLMVATLSQHGKTC